MTEYEEVALQLYRKRTQLSRTNVKATRERLESEIAALVSKRETLPKPQQPSKIKALNRNCPKPTPAPKWHIAINEMKDVMRHECKGYEFIGKCGNFVGHPSWFYDHGTQLNGDGYRTTGKSRPIANQKN